MVRTAALFSLLWAASLLTGQPAPVHTFDDHAAGSPPAGFDLTTLRQTSAGRWLVRRDGTHGALVHLADPTAAGFALALAPDSPLRDVQAVVRLRLTGGTRSGGLVWRYTDEAHYYAAVLDLARGAISLFRVTDGNRTFLESEDGLELDPAAWHTLKISHDEARITVLLGGIKVIEERDRRYDRATEPGRTGVIAAGGSEVWFDDLRIEPDRDRKR